MSLSLHESVSLITSFPSEIETRCHKVMFHTKSPSLHFSIPKFSDLKKNWTVGVLKCRYRQCNKLNWQIGKGGNNHYH